MQLHNFQSKIRNNELTSFFGSGQLGHSWVIIFNSDKPGDYTSYGFHDKYGFVKNGTA